MDGLQGRFTGVATSLKGIAQAGAVVGAISFFKGAIDEAREAERVTRKTEAVIKSTGGQARVTAGHIGELSEKMSELAGVDDEVIQQGANVLLTFTKVRNEIGNGNDIFDQAAKVSLDMAAAMDKTGDSGATMQESVIRIGKALNDPIKGMSALTKVGVTFTAQQKDQVKALVESGDVMGAQKVILRELQTEFGGMAAASADATDKAAVSWGNFAEDIGKKVMPAVNAVSNWALHTGIPALGALADTAGEVVVPAFRAVVSTGQGLLGFWHSLPTEVQYAAVAMAGWAVVGDRVGGTFGRASGSVRGFGDDVHVAMGAFDVGRVQAGLMVLEERVPVVGAMGKSFRDTAGAGLALSNTMPGLSGGMLQFSSVVRGSASAALTGLKAAGSSLMGLMGGPWGVAIAGAAAALGFLASKSSEAKAKQEQMYNAGKRIAEIMHDQADATRDKVRADVIAEASSTGLLRQAKALGISLPLVTEALMGNEGAYKRVQAAIDRKRASAEADDDANETAVSGLMDLFHGTGGAADALDGFSGSMQKAVQGNADAALGYKLQAEALGKVTEGTSRYAVVGSMAVTSTDLMKGAIEGAGIEFDAAGTEVDQMREAIDALNRQSTIATDTWEGYEASVDALSESIQVNKGTLDIHTEAGRANRDALEEVAAKSRDLMLADIESGAPADEALARHNARIVTLKDEATAAFGTNAETGTLIDTYGRVPKSIETAITQKGAEAVQAAMDRLSAGQYLLANAMPATPANVRAVLQERRSRYAGGGPVRGPGTPTSDSIPALLSNREFVHTAAATDYYGESFMSALNQKRIPREALPGYARGGMVVPVTVNLSKTKIPDPMAASVIPGGASIRQMQQFARMQAGKRYQWGATGPNTWDCSGLVGAFWAMAHGQNPYQRHMTTEGMGVGRYGMKAGRGPVTVYLGPGHTAANIGGLHAEAYGGNGVPLAIGRVGTPLSYYNQVMHLAKGGMARLKNNPDVRQESFLSKGWPEPSRVGMFKDGGWLKPGQFAYNETSKPEPILSSEQWAAMERPNVTKNYNLTVQAKNYAVDVATQFAYMEALAGI
jgi:cell wall-associated NlpC family hydrolase